MEIKINQNTPAETHVREKSSTPIECVRLESVYKRKSD